MLVPKIILDTDPGGDDTFALLWLLSLMKQGLAELLAVTTAAGNVSAQRTFTSASQLLALTGYPAIPVGKGIAAAVDAEDASHIHGADGMGNLSATLPPASHSFDTARYADDILIEALSAAPGEITVVAIAPLTNLAAAERKHPGILQKAKEIVIMAGAFLCPGNVTPHAEFNVWFNPEAAQIVLTSRHDIVIMPLDITRQLVFTSDMAYQVSQRNPNSAISQFLLALCQFMVGTALKYRETNGMAGFLVHDAVTLSYLFYPETLRFSRAAVVVETHGEWTRGQTLCDRRQLAKTGANAWVAAEINTVGFFTSLLADLQQLIEG